MGRKPRRLSQRPYPARDELHERTRLR
jgi:hypothetical protein